MSRIAKNFILPNEVKVSFDKIDVLFESKLGKLSLSNVAGINCDISEKNEVSFKKEKRVLSRDLGTFVANFKNAVNGLVKKYEKTLNLVGVGYKVDKKQNGLEFAVGYSHLVFFDNVEGVEFDVIKNVKLIVKSCNKQLLGQVCSEIVKKTRKPEPYKGKGVIIEGSYVIRKQGKKK